MKEEQVQNHNEKDKKNVSNRFVGDELFTKLNTSIPDLDDKDLLEIYANLGINISDDKKTKYIFGENGGVYEIRNNFYQDCPIDSSQTELKEAIDFYNPDRKLVAKIYPGGGYTPCFENEIEAMERLGIFYDYVFDEEDQAHLFLREYIPGETLCDFVAHNNLSELDKITIMINILQEIDNIHKKNILHCDLKTSNILVDNDLTVYIFDFGASSIIENFEQENYPRYKYYIDYMPPELGEKDVNDPIGKGTDIYFLKEIIKALKLKELSPKIEKLYMKVQSPKQEDRGDIREIYEAFLQMYSKSSKEL